MLLIFRTLQFSMNIVDVGVVETPFAFHFNRLLKCVHCEFETSQQQPTLFLYSLSVPHPFLFLSFSFFYTLLTESFYSMP